MFGPFWLLFHAAWIPAAIVVAVEVLLRVGVHDPARGAIGFGVAWGLGLFGRDLWGWSLERRGWVLAYVVVARGRTAAEHRLLGEVPALQAAYAG